MTAEWSGKVNQKFYNYSESFKDNSVSQEYNSGRKVVFLKNTKFLKNIKVSLSVDVRNGEFDAFNAWFTDELGGLSGTFTCQALGAATYRFTKNPQFSSGQRFRTAELEIEEV